MQDQGYDELMRLSSQLPEPGFPNGVILCVELVKTVKRVAVLWEGVIGTTYNSRIFWELHLQKMHPIFPKSEVCYFIKNIHLFNHIFEEYFAIHLSIWNPRKRVFQIIIIFQSSKLCKLCVA